MKKFALMLTVAAVMGIVCSGVMAKDKAAGAGDAKEKPKGAAGTLAIVKNDKGEVTAITITDKKGNVCNVDMTNFKQDCAGLDGQKVHARGEVKEVDGKKTIVVSGEIKKMEDKGDKKKEGGKK
jgi:hypothetical protein